MSNLRRTIDLYRHLGWWRSIVFTLAIALPVFGFVALGTWLSMRIGWPGAYGFSCHGRGCLYKDMYYSFRLLRHHTPDEIGLFAWIWSLPVLTILACAFVVLRRRARTWRNRIRPMDD